MSINIQPTLENEIVILFPLQEQDFEELYLAASDPKIWGQHPNKARYRTILLILSASPAQKAILF